MYINDEALKRKMIFAKKLNARFAELNTMRNNLHKGDMRRMELLDRMRMINRKIIRTRDEINQLLTQLSV